MQSTRQQFFKGAIDMLPLSIAVIPWGILAGSMAIHAGLPWEKALAMSALVFAGAAQLLSLGLVIAGASTLSILVSVYFLTTQHLIYALTLRNHIAKQVWYVRMTQAFLLTDEQFALSASKQQYSMAYLFGASFVINLKFVMVLVLNCLIFSAVGFIAALLIDAHEDMGNFNTYILLPMSFLCGTFFSTEKLPQIIHYFLELLPLTHASNALRVLGSNGEITIFPVAVLVIYAIGLSMTCWWCMENLKK